MYLEKHKHKQTNNKETKNKTKTKETESPNFDWRSVKPYWFLGVRPFLNINTNTTRNYFCPKGWPN